MLFKKKKENKKKNTKKDNKRRRKEFTIYFVGYKERIVNPLINFAYQIWRKFLRADKYNKITS